MEHVTTHQASDDAYNLDIKIYVNGWFCPQGGH